MKFSVEEVARMCHETNRLYCNKLGDYTQVPWDFSPEWLQKSVIDGVTFHMNNPNADASASHENWLRFKAIDGWKYGPVKDIEKKEHPCYLPFADLPFEQQVKDRLFKAIVHAMLIEE